MNKEDCKIHDFLLITRMGPDIGHWTVYPHDAPFKGRYAGRHALNPNYGYVRTETDDLWMFEYAYARHDPAHHYNKSMAPDGYGPTCACGHPYGRHFDGYEEDVHGRTMMVGCKYCDCGLWHPPTPQNQLNRLHDRRTYTLRITRAAEVEIRKHDDTSWKDREDTTVLELHTILHNVTVIRSSVGEDDKGDYFVRYTTHAKEKQQFTADRLPHDAFVVLTRAWDPAFNGEDSVYEPNDKDLELENFQPEQLRLSKEVRVRELTGQEYWTGVEQKA